MAIDRKFAGWSSLVIASVLAFAVWVLVVLAASRPAFRTILDTTPGRSTSVRPGTGNLIADLQDRAGERIEIYSFFEPLPSGQTPQQRALVAIWRRVQSMTVALLRQYSALGGDKVRVEHIDPRRNPDTAREVDERLGGVKDRHVIVVAVVRDKPDGGEAVQKKVIPVRDLAIIDSGGQSPMPGSSSRMPLLEQFTGEAQISSAMKTLLAGGTPVVYLLEGHGEELAQQGNSPYDYTNLVAGLQAEGFKVADLNLNEQGVPENATVLACLEPEVEFLDSECEAIHAWLKRGGRMFLNVSYHDVATRNPKLQNLLGPLGVAVGDRMVMQFWDQAPQSKAVFLEIYPKNTALPMTRPLVAARRTIGVRYARPIEEAPQPVDGASLDRSLLRTERNCWLAERKSGVETSFAVGDSMQSFSVGAVVTVKAEQGGHPGRLLLVSGQAFNNAHFTTGSQQDLALNSFAWLAERVETIDLREREGRPKAGIIERSANPDDIERLRSRARYLLLLGVPIGFVGAGLIVWWRRRRI